MFEIEKIVKNFLHWKKDNRGFTSFYRFNKTQFEEYKKDSNFDVMSQSSAGVYLSFYTTGDEVSFDCKIISAGKFISAFIKDFDIHNFRNLLWQLEKKAEENHESVIKPILKERIEGDLRFDGFDFVLNNTHVNFHELSNGNISFKIFNPNKEKVHIKIHLPLIFPVSIKNLKINGDFEYDMEDKDNIICFGDSITQGLFAGNPTANYVNRLSSFLNVNGLNQGVSGYMFNHKSLNGLENINVDPKFITVAYGTNDWSKKSSLDEVVNDMELYFEKLALLFKTKKIFVFTPIWRANLNKVSNVGSFYQIRKNIIQITNKYENITVIDGINFVPHSSYYFADEYLHPNSDGFEHMAYNIKNEIEKFNI